MPSGRSDVYVYNRTKESFLALRVKVADTIWGRLIGLLGRRSLNPEAGVWIVPCNSIHTFGMLFSIDAVFLDKEFKVVGLRELLRPFSITRPHFRAESVIELPPHTIFRSGTQIGDQLEIERYEVHRAADSDLADTSGPYEMGIPADQESPQPLKGRARTSSSNCRALRTE
jgi:uncharacterized protein